MGSCTCGLFSICNAHSGANGTTRSLLLSLAEYACKKIKINIGLFVFPVKIGFFCMHMHRRAYDAFLEAIACCKCTWCYDAEDECCA